MNVSLPDDRHYLIECSGDKTRKAFRTLYLNKPFWVYDVSKSKFNPLNWVKSDEADSFKWQGVQVKRYDQRLSDKLEQFY